jgi:TM2 domain-containing membrane protein YozV
MEQMNSNNFNNTPNVGKDWLTTLLLCIFLGNIGIHRFYTGHIGIGIAQVLTLGGCGIWTLVDLIFIATDKFTDSDGNALVKK